MRIIQDNELNITARALINRKQLLKIVPLSERTIFDLEKRGQFPKRFALTERNVAWDLEEVKEWIEDRKASGQSIFRPSFLSS